MGYYVEVNTLVRLTDDIVPSSLVMGKKYTIKRERERIVPLHIALLLIDKEWNFYGYCRVNQTIVSDDATEMEVEILSLFDETERAIYKNKFIEAGKVTGEVK